MMIQVQTFKNGAHTVFDREMPAGLFVVKVYGPTGNLIDKVRCDDYRNARAYLRSFNKIARNA